MRKLTIIFFLSLILFHVPALFAEDEKITDSEKDSSLDVENINVEEVAEPQFYWTNPYLTQFSKLLPKLSKSLGKLDNRVSRIAIADFAIDEELDETFKKVALNKIYGNLLSENPRLKLIRCEECNTTFSEVRGGVLRISRGMATQEDRRRIANKIKAEGFLRGSITVDKGVITMVVSVYEAEKGRIIYSDVFTGNKIPETAHTNVFTGIMYIPIKIKSGQTVTHEAYMFGVEQTIRFKEDWLFAINSALYIDNNSNLQVDGSSDAETVTLDTGITLDGSLMWDGASDANKFFTFAPFVGLGQFIYSPQFNYNQYFKGGVRMVLGQSLVFNLSGYYFLGNQIITKEDTTTGTGAEQLNNFMYSLTVGYQW